MLRAVLKNIKRIDKNMPSLEERNSIIENNIQYLRDKYQIDPKRLILIEKAVRNALKAKYIESLFLPLESYEKLFDALADFVASSSLIEESQARFTSVNFNDFLLSILFLSATTIIVQENARAIKNN